MNNYRFVIAIWVLLLTFSVAILFYQYTQDRHKEKFTDSNKELDKLFYVELTEGVHFNYDNTVWDKENYLYLLPKSSTHTVQVNNLLKTNSVFYIKNHQGKTWEKASLKTMKQNDDDPGKAFVYLENAHGNIHHIIDKDEGIYLTKVNGKLKLSIRC